MAGRSTVWGIDVGQCSLKAIKLQQVGGAASVLAFDLVEHDTILSQAETNAAEIISKAIGTFASRNDLRDSGVAIAIAGQQTLTRFTKMPPVEPKKIPDMVQYEASQQIPFDMDEVVWDYQVFTEKDSPDVEVGIFAIRKELIRNYVAHFTEKGIEPVVVQTGPMASYNAAFYERGGEGDNQATILLDMGALGTDLIVMEGRRIWARHVPIGGNRFTEALVTAFKIPFKKAEKLKRNAATSKYARQVFAAMRPVFADLVSEVQRSIGYYTSTHREAHITRVLGMGNAFKLPGLQKFLQQNLQIEVERFAGFTRINAGDILKSPAYADNVASFAVAYGLALQGLGLAAVNSNLLPIEIRKAMLWRKKKPWFAAAAACLALAAGALWVGNVVAQNQLDKAIGDLASVAPVFVQSEEEAERLVSAAANDPPVAKAAKVAGAAQRLQEVMSSLDRLRSGDQALINVMAKLPENNVYMPRIIDLIHRAFAAALPADLREARNSGEYLSLARQTPRADRREIWIDSIPRMIFHPRNPEGAFASDAKESKEQIPRSNKPGWAIRIIGGTTMPQPAKYIEENLVAAFDKLGREPNRGIYVHYVKLSKVLRRRPTQAFFGGPGDEEGPAGRGGRSPGYGYVDPPIPEPEETGGRGGRGGAIVPSPRGGTRQITADVVTEEIGRLRKALSGKDPLTEESTKDDQWFQIDLVIIRDNTPPQLIPEEYKPRKEPAKQPGDEPAQPGG